MAIGDKIKALRKENKISQEELAHEIGVSRQIVCEWERGKRTPTLVNVNALATFFHVSVDFFFESAVENVTKNNSDKKPKRKRSKQSILWLICSCISGAILLFALCIFITFFVLLVINQNKVNLLLFDDKWMLFLMFFIFIFLYFIVSIYFLHKETKKGKNE